jgi:hypothetical protein
VMNVKYEMFMIVVNASYHIYCEEMIIMCKKEMMIKVIIVNCNDITTNANDTQRHNYIHDITL